MWSQYTVYIYCISVLCIIQLNRLSYIVLPAQRLKNLCLMPGNNSAVAESAENDLQLARGGAGTDDDLSCREGRSGGCQHWTDSTVAHFLSQTYFVYIYLVKGETGQSVLLT